MAWSSYSRSWTEQNLFKRAKLKNKMTTERLEEKWSNGRQTEDSGQLDIVSLEIILVKQQAVDKCIDNAMQYEEERLILKIEL